MRSSLTRTSGREYGGGDPRAVLAYEPLLANSIVTRIYVQYMPPSHSSTIRYAPSEYTVKWIHIQSAESS